MPPSCPETTQKVEKLKKAAGRRASPPQARAGGEHFLPEVTRLQAQFGSPQTKGILGPREEPK